MSSISGPSRKEAYEEAIRKSFEIVEDLIKSLATKKQFSDFFDLEQKRWPTRKDTWRDNNAKTVPRQRHQGDVGNCWAVGTFRQWYSRSVINGEEPSGLTVKNLTLGISDLHKDPEHGLKDWNAVISFMKRKRYVEDMLIHHKPEGHAEEETFENFLVHLCSDGPITVVYNHFNSYHEDPEFRIRSPTPNEAARSDFEANYEIHAALLMGKGIDINGNEYWEIFESRGRRYGDSGFIRLATKQGLIISATEMKMFPKE